MVKSLARLLLRLLSGSFMLVLSVRQVLIDTQGVHTSRRSTRLRERVQRTLDAHTRSLTFPWDLPDLGPFSVGFQASWSRCQYCGALSEPRAMGEGAVPGLSWGAPCAQASTHHTGSVGRL